MGNINKKKKNENNKDFYNYHCIKCGEIPIIDFFNNDFDMICSKHKILNIPYTQFYNFIIYDYKCSICQKSSINNIFKFFFCDKCDKIFCIICLKSHNKNNKLHIVNNINDINTICKHHNKKYIKYCLQCKLNLCELCDNHIGHYVENFEDVYPLKDEIDQFKKSINQIIEQKGRNNFIEILLLLINSFSNIKTNYYYINNINNIIKKTILIDELKNNDNNINNNKDKNRMAGISIRVPSQPDKTDIKYIEDYQKSNDINNIENKVLIKVLELKVYSIWCMKKLNDIIINSGKKLELIAMGGSDNKIILINTTTFNIHQTIFENKGTVYSLEQYKDDPNYLYSSSSYGNINIYKLSKNNKYDLIQTLEKSQDKRGGEINKVIILSNKLLVSGDHRSITIWSEKNQDENKINYEDFFEIIINRDTCHLLEVNPSIFVATQYSSNGYFQVYINDGKTFPLKGELKNVKSHGSSSNGLSKINNNLVCSSSEGILYIISIEPLQIIQKIKNNEKNTIYYNYITKNNYLYFTERYDYISQYKIIFDEENEFVEIVKVGEYNVYSQKAIIPFDDGRIFFKESRKRQEDRFILIA